MGETAIQPSPRRYTLAHLLLVVPWVALVIDAWAPIRDNSFLWHIRAGELQWRRGQVLTEDPFSFTMLGEPWLTQSWLAELVYAAGEAWSGLGFVPPMMLALNLVSFAGLGLIAHRRSGSVAATALLLLLSTVLLVSFLVPRPVLFSFPLFTLVVLAWDRPQTRWALPLLFWIWASVHGSFAIGLAYVGLSLLAEREWRALPTAVVSGLATLLTAHGLGVITILAEFVEARPALALLSEWRRPDLVSLTFTPLLVGVSLIVLGAYRGKVHPRHLWLLVPFLLLAFSATRAVPPAWVGLVPLVALSLQGWGEGGGRSGEGRFSAPAAATYALAVLFVPFLLAAEGRIDDERFPVAALAHLGEGHTFHDDRVGGYLIWAEGPERLVYVDDRAELYGERLAEFVEVRDGLRDWEPVFERDGIEQALLRREEDLTSRLADAGWSKVYEDDRYVILRP